MLLDLKTLLRAFAPGRAAHALKMLEKSTALIVSTCWLAALVTLALAIMAAHGAVSFKKEVVKAVAVEPVLPTITANPISQNEIQMLADQLRHQFPEIRIDVKNPQGKASGAIEIGTDDGSRFHEWITAISYLDTMAPQYRWTLGAFCTGACPGGHLMTAALTGQKLVISMPKPKANR
jgi:hypothetical protein